MSSYISFMKKEFIEYTRTYKLFIMGIVFLLFGMMNPVVAKFAPELIKTAMPEMNIDIPEPTAMDSWAQFFKNVGQLGVVTLVIVFSGLMSNELSKGTLINMLTKGLKRSTVILSKFTMATIIWTISYLLCFGVSYVYTAYFWSMDGMNHVFLAFSSLWLFGVLLINLVILGGILFKNTFGSLLLTGGSIAVMGFLNIVPRLKKYNTLSLASYNMSILNAQMAVSDFVPAFVVCFILIVTLLVISILIFNKKQI